MILMKIMTSFPTLMTVITMVTTISRIFIDFAREPELEVMITNMFLFLDDSDVPGVPDSHDTDDDGF